MTGSRTRHLHKAGALLQAQTQINRMKRTTSLPSQQERVTQQSQPMMQVQEQMHKRIRLTQTATLSQPRVKQ